MKRFALPGAILLASACSAPDSARREAAPAASSDTVVIDGDAPGCESCALVVGDPVRLGSTTDRQIPRRVPTVLRDSRGTAYLVFVGWGNQPTLQYDSAGRFLRQIGRSGSGPGEYNMAWRAFIGPGDSLYLHATGQVLIVYGPDGSFVRTLRLPSVQVVGMLGDGTVLATRPYRFDGAETFLLRLAADGTIRDSFPIFSPMNGLVSTISMRRDRSDERRVERRHESRPIAGDDGSIWTYEDLNFRLEKFDSAGRPDRLIGVRLPDRPAPIMTVQQAESAAAVTRAQVASAPEPVALANDMARPPRSRTTVMVDSAGLLWIVRNVPAPAFDTIRFEREDMSKTEAPGELVIPRDIEDRRSHTIVEVIDPVSARLLARATLPFLGLPAAPGYIGRVSQDEEGFYVPLVYPVRLRRR